MSKDSSSARILASTAFLEAIRTHPDFASTIQSSPAPPEEHSPPPPLPPFYDVTSILLESDHSNPGLGMPLSFVRRFHNDHELE
jgi:hypothetical protein